MSDKSVAERLQVKPGRTLAVLDAPPTLEKLIGAAKSRAALADADVVLLFAPSQKKLESQVKAALKNLRADAILWLAYPKLTSALAGDLSRDVIRAAMPRFGLDTVSQIAIDDDWSALRVKRV